MSIFTTTFRIMDGSHLIIAISTCCVTTVKRNSRSFRNRLLFENRMKNVVMRAEFSAFSAAWNACFDIPYGNRCNFVGNELVTIIFFAQFFIVEYTIQHFKPIWNRIQIVVSRTLCRFFLGAHDRSRRVFTWVRNFALFFTEVAHFGEVLWL